MCAVRSKNVAPQSQATFHASAPIPKWLTHSAGSTFGGRVASGQPKAPRFFRPSRIASASKA